MEDKIKNILINKFEFILIDTKANETDILIEHNNKYLSIEVKGIKKSCTSEHVLKCSKWMKHSKSILLKKGISIRDMEIKSLLVANPMMFEDVKNRVDEFPDDTKYTAQMEEVGMIRTLDLLYLFNDFCLGTLSSHEIFDILYNIETIYKK